MTWPTVTPDPDVHPQVMEIRDPDSQEVLGALVLDRASDRTYPLDPRTAAWLREQQAPTFGVGHMPLPWQIETPLYAQVCQAQGHEPLGIAHRWWLDPATGEIAQDMGGYWQRVVPER